MFSGFKITFLGGKTAKTRLFCDLSNQMSQKCYTNTIFNKLNGFVAEPVYIRLYRNYIMSFRQIKGVFAPLLSNSNRRKCACLLNLLENYENSEIYVIYTIGMSRCLKKVKTNIFNKVKQQGSYLVS